MHTITRISSFEADIDIIVVLPKDEIERWKKLCITHLFDIKHHIVEGGSERFFSVKNALHATNNEGLIYIHDGVRPFLSKDTWERCTNCAIENNTAVACIPIIPSLRKITEVNKTKSVDRTQYLDVQTPQVFKSEIIKRAYAQEFSSSFTDDASVAERAGFETFTCLGNVENIKITTAFDIKIAEILI